MNCCMRRLKRENLLFLVSFVFLTFLLILSSCNTKKETNNKLTNGTPLRVKAYPEPGTYPSSYNLKVTLVTNRDAYVYLTLDGSIPTPGMATTFGGKAPIYDIPIIRDTWLCYYAVDTVGDQTPVNCVFYHIQPPPESKLFPLPGAYNHPLDVTISTNVPAVIYYTTDGLDPEPGAEDTEEGKAPVSVHIPHTLTLKYFAVDDLGDQEDIKSARYIIDTTPPHSVAIPAGGDYNSPIKVTLKITNDVGTIYYTTNGQDPSEYDLYANGGSTKIGKVKVEGINVNSSTVIKFFAVDAVGNREFPPDANPPYHQEFYVLNNRPVLYAKPNGGYFQQTTVTVGLYTFPSDTKIYYGIDEIPTATPAYLYNGPFVISGEGEHTLYFFGVNDGNTTRLKQEVYHLGFVRPPETFTEDFTNTDYIDVTDSTGVIFDTKKGLMILDKHHASFLQNVNSDDVDLDLDYYFEQSSYKGYLVVAERFAGLGIYDVSDAAAVKKIATLPVNPGNLTTGPYFRVSVSSNLSIAAVAYYLGVLIVDLSYPNVPTVEVDIPNLSEVSYPPHPSPVPKIIGNYLYVGGFKNGKPTLFVYDISAPYNPVLKKSIEGVTGAPIVDMAFGNNKLLLLTGNGRVRRVNISNLTDPVKEGVVKMCNNCAGTSIAINGDYAYAGYTYANGGNFALLKYPDGVSPVVVNDSLLSLSNNPVNGISVNSEKLMAISNGNRGVWIYTVADPAHPKELDLITPQIAKSYAFAPGVNFLKDYTLFVIDPTVGYKTFKIPVDIGDYLNEGVGLSFNINPHSYRVGAVKLNAVQSLNSGSIDYKVSPDGGMNWYAVNGLGSQVIFPDPGADLRWKAILHSSDPTTSPVVDSITITIYYAE